MAEKQVSEKNEKDSDEPGKSTCDQKLGCLQDTEKSTDELEGELTNDFYAACEISMQLMDDAKPGTSSQNTAEEVPEHPQDSGLMTASSDTSIQIPWSEESLSKLMGNMSDDRASSAMLTMMSKEMLYPILKAMSEMYPEWLIENKHKMSPNLYATYSNQYLLICEACDELEDESENDSQTVKERSEKVLDLVQQIQDCCEPPKELTSRVSASHLQEDPTAVELCLIM